MTVYVRRSHPELPSIEQQARDVFLFTRELAKFSPLLARWYLPGSSKEEALLYEAFDKDGPTNAALAVWRTAKKNADTIRTLSLWNGADNERDAGISYMAQTLGQSDTIRFTLGVEPEIADWRIAEGWVRTAIELWKPEAIVFGAHWYVKKKVFKDRPGAGWLLYLAKPITRKHVPEAAEVLPVVRDGKHVGSIILSVAEGPFSDENPEHVLKANAVEIRLVDQDLLPLFSEL